MGATKRIVVIASVGLLLFGFASMGLGQVFFVKDTVKITEGPKWAPGEILVKFLPGTSGAVIDAVNGRHGTAVISTSRFAGFKRLRIPPGKTVPEMVEIYKRNPNVEYAEPNFIATTMVEFNDPGYYLQWHLDNPGTGGIHMESAWDIAGGGDESVIVAVIDTGVAYEYYREFVDNPGRGQDYWITYQEAPDLAETHFVAGYDFVNDDTHPNDDEGHGTHVTGTIAQSTDNGIGVAGIAFNTAIMPIKVLDRNGSGTYGNIADGIYFAANHGARVINMSLGGSSGSITLEAALAYAYNKDVTIVCASGNDGSAETVSYPAAYDAYCIAVGATRYDEAVAYYSNGGPSLDLTAPGGDINVDQNGDGFGDGVLQQTFGANPTDFGYYFYQGTSMATPHVSGVAALLIAQGVATPDAVREALQATAEDHGATGLDPQYGWGIINAYKALTYYAAPNERPVADAGGPYSGTEDQDVTFNGSGSYDPDDDPLTYRWDFGDGSTGSGEKSTHAYSTGGTYTVTLIVNDGKADSDPDTTTATIAHVNDAPVADAGPDQSAVVGETVTFDGTSSFDEDGTITSYDWDFGDETTGSGVTATHTYSTAGIYIVTLTVTDEGDLTGSDTAKVTVTEAQALTMHVANIDMSLKKAGPNVEAIATVTVVDGDGAPVGGATVSGRWSGLTNDSDSGITGDNGTVSLHSNKVKNASGTFTFTVDNITKDGWTYDPDANEETSGSITVR